MTLQDLAAELLELRRYVRSHPAHVRDGLGELFRHIYKAKGPYSMGLRLGDNLFVALNRCYIFNDAGEFVDATNVEILEGYLYGAAHEIREHAERGMGE